MTPWPMLDTCGERFAASCELADFLARRTNKGNCLGMIILVLNQPSSFPTGKEQQMLSWIV